MSLRRKPGAPCTVCKHRELAAIDLGLARGVSVRALATRHGLGRDSLYRHSNKHLPPQLRAKLIAGPSIDVDDIDKLREDESRSLLAHLVGLRGRLFSSLDVAEEAGDGGFLARIAGQLHHNLELTGKLLGDLGGGTSTTINNMLLCSPAYVELRLALVTALRPYPDAASAVAAALHTLEQRAADDVRSASKAATLIEATAA